MDYRTDLTLLLEEVEARVAALAGTEMVMVGRGGGVRTVSPEHGQKGDLRDAVALFLFSPTEDADGSSATELLGYKIAHENGIVRFRRFSTLELQLCYKPGGSIRYL